jgi:hypothetical protein
MIDLREAVYRAGAPPRTMYRWLADPNFQAALRAARRGLFEESLGILERGASRAVQALIDEIKGGQGVNDDRSAFVIDASKAVIDRAFRA